MESFTTTTTSTTNQSLVAPKRRCKEVMEALAQYKAKVRESKLCIKNAKHSAHEAKKQMRLAKREMVQQVKKIRQSKQRALQTVPSPATSQADVPDVFEYQPQLDVLTAEGFDNPKLVTRLLKQFKGGVDKTRIRLVAIRDRRAARAKPDATTTETPEFLPAESMDTTSPFEVAPSPAKRRVRDAEAKRAARDARIQAVAEHRALKQAAKATKAQRRRGGDPSVL